MGGMKIYYQQIYYEGQEGNLNDTVKFVVPASVLDGDFEAALKTAKERFSLDEYEDRLEMVDDMMDFVASQLNGAWEYLDISGVTEIAYDE